MLGYMTAKEAKQNGLQYHGSYYGIPVWMGDIDSYAPRICTKWAAMEPVMSLFHIIEGFLAPVVWGESAFKFTVLREIE